MHYALDLSPSPHCKHHVLLPITLAKNITRVNNRHCRNRSFNPIIAPIFKLSLCIHTCNCQDGLLVLINLPLSVFLNFSVRFCVIHVFEWVCPLSYKFLFYSIVIFPLNVPNLGYLWIHLIYSHYSFFIIFWLIYLLLTYFVPAVLFRLG